MNYINHQHTAKDGTELVTYHWESELPKGIVHIVHGMSEHAERYDHFATFLTANGYVVYSSDLRGHGKTAGSIENVGQFAMENGWKKVVGDIIELSQKFKAEHPDVPLIILGHSMGSFIARNVAYEAPDLADAFIFSATNGHPGLIGVVGKSFANFNMKLIGKKKRSKLMDKLVFGDFNKKYENPRTNKDWLSRDNSIVDQYINDPYCMQTFTAQFFTDLLHGILDIQEFSNISKMNKSTPVLLFSGDMDPVGDYGRGPKQVYAKFKRANIENVTLEMYEEGRHEMLNEINKDEVYLMVLNWLDGLFANE